LCREVAKRSKTHQNAAKRSESQKRSKAQQNAAKMLQNAAKNAAKRSITQPHIAEFQHPTLP